MKLLSRIAFILFAVILSACAQETPTVAETVDFASVCDQANEGKRVAVQGYLRLPDSFTGDQSVVLRLYENDSFAGTPIGVQTSFGSEANQAEMVPVEYRDTDLKIHLADGSLLEFGTTAKVSGKVYYPVVDQDFDCGLENPLIGR